MKNAEQTAQKSLVVNGVVIHYDNELATKHIVEEVFEKGHFDFNSNKDDPVIIDCGAHVGVTSIFFKIKYPKSTILCFEPDPAAFKTLKKNMVFNNIEGVTLHNVAVSKISGEIDFYGQVDVDHPDTRGNSIIPSWGMQRPIAHAIKVLSVQLSKYVDRNIDLLKLNIEGAEQQVLEEIEEKLKHIKCVIVEVHETEQMRDINSLEKIISLLERNNFTTQVSRLNENDIWPEIVKEWVHKARPKLFSVRAINKEVIALPE